MRQFSLLVVLMLILVACSPQGDDDTPAPTTTDISNATLPTDAFLEPTSRITPQNAPNLRQLGILERPAGRVSSIFNHAVSADGTRLVALNNDLLLVWNLVTGNIIYNTSQTDAIQAHFAPNQDEIYIIRADGLVLVYASDSARPITEIVGNQNFNGKVAYQPEFGYLALGGSDGVVKVWDVAQRTSMVTLQAHEAPILALSFDASGERLATTAEDNFAKIWDWRTRTTLNTFDHIDSNAEQVTLSPDGSQLVTGTLNYVAVWSAEDDELSYSLAIDRGGATNLLAYSADGDLIASGGGVSNLLVWRSQTGEVVASLPEVSGDRLSGAFGADGNLLLTSVLDRAVSLWDIANANEETVPRATLDIGTRRIVRADWTEDGFLMLFFDVEGVVYVWGIVE